MEPESFFHVALKTDDLAASTDFYVEGFDGEVVDRGEASEGEGATAVDYVALAVADKRIYLFDRAPYEATGAVESMPTGFLHFGFVVADAGRAFEELVADGAGAVMAPATFGELTIAFLEAPDGVIVELLEHR
jgi:catechol 2,3-dioxygenase-like lactoylglutathione lyase family enzyme